MRPVAWEGYAFPDTEETECPRLDSVVKQNTSKDIKDTDMSATKLQTLTLDTTIPLVLVLEETQRGTLTDQVAIQAASTALTLIGNASAHMTAKRRKQVLKDLNKDLLPQAEEAETFKGAAPLLFKENFEIQDEPP